MWDGSKALGIAPKSRVMFSIKPNMSNAIYPDKRSPSENYSIHVKVLLTQP